MTIIVPDPISGDGSVILPDPAGPELAVQRKLTRAFIARQPVTVTLVPRTKVKKPSGGFGWEDGTPRDPQVMTLIEPGSIPLPIVTVDGVQRETDFELLGEADAVIETNDRFTLDGFTYDVTRIGHANGWEQRALVSKLG